MNPQEQQEKIEELSKGFEKLNSDVKEYTSKLDNLIDSPVRVDKSISQNSKDSIISTTRWFERRTDLVVGAAFQLFPHTQYLKLTATAARTSNTTIAIFDGNYVGQRLYVEGTSNTNTVTIKDNANTLMNGDVTLGIGDVITFIWNGGDWVELSRSINGSVTSNINARSYGSGVTSINDATDTKVTLATNSFANNITWDASTSKFTILTAGIYLITARVTYTNTTDGKLYKTQVSKNSDTATMILLADAMSSVAGGTCGAVAADLQSLAVSDTLELYTYHNAGAAQTIGTASSLTYLSVVKV